MSANHSYRTVQDLTTRGIGVNADAASLVLKYPRVEKSVPGKQWAGQIGKAQAVVRLPDKEVWNGKLIIGATPAVRNEFSMDLLLSDIVMQKGYAYAACDKGTPKLVLRDPNRQMTEWIQHYHQLTLKAMEMVASAYSAAPKYTYIAGVSNGGYITRAMLERYPELFAGGVDWSGVFWHPKSPHLLTCLPEFIQEYPIFANWRGDRTSHDRRIAYDKLLQAGLHPDSEPYWHQYFMTYWVFSLWLYGRNLDPDWEPFKMEWNNDWLRDPSPLIYPYQEREDILQEHIKKFANDGHLTKPLLSVAGNWDCLITFTYHAKAYNDMVEHEGCSKNHRLYEIPRGNHVDGLLKSNQGKQQTVHPYFEAALYHLEKWAERNILPPESGIYETIESFAPSECRLFTK
ncbi:prolyl oligopeptidase family serine peptidase [Scopulibacillus cellulosilyticus]|uniref:Prolyl oligopeptidase family serine peptidase n=1 Tax=Scopulibacillus cellulosilyticus TaxID=2665665 RepID=A0ABW2PRI2_9BACL